MCFSSVALNASRIICYRQVTHPSRTGGHVQDTGVGVAGSVPVTKLASGNVFSEWMAGGVAPLSPGIGGQSGSDE